MSSEHPPVANHIGARIRAIRHLRGMTQTNVAERAGSGSGQVSRAENGVRLPTLPGLQRLAQALGVGLGDLLDVEPNALPPELVVLLADLRAARPEVQKAALALLTPHLNAESAAPTAWPGGEHVG